MLVDAQHRRTRSSISPDLMDTYVRYKQDTRAIIAWLIGHGMPKQGCFQTVRIKDLLDIAETVQRKAVVMPDMIDFHFREAIAARTQLSKIFRKEALPGVQDQETLNHEYFTTSLNKIYIGLCEFCDKPMRNCEQTNLGRSCEASQKTLSNRFAVLKVGASDHDSPSGDNQPNRECNECARQDSTAKAKVPAIPRLVDDHLGDAFDIRKEVQELSDLRLATVGIWEEAARGETPLVLAAFITNAAFAAFEEIEQRLKSLCNDLTPNALRNRLMQIEEGSEVSQDIGASQDTPEARQMEDLQQVWDLLLRFKGSHQDRKHDKDFSTVPRPSQIILRKGPNSAPINSECLSMMLQTIEKHVRTRCRPTCIVRLGSPTYADIGYFLTHDEDDSNGLRCSFGLQMLLETYKGYLLASQNNIASSSCRLQALKFAQEAMPHIRAVLDDSSMPCRCCHTLAFHLENLHFDFKKFLGEMVFDLYFQSPWVSGSHILEMLELLFYYGLRLFSYRHYAGSVLHVYNILRECTGFQPISLLEQLCETFSDILFPGGRPTRSFKACCFRYMGGRLKFNPNASDHKSGSHKFCIPARTAKATAGYGLQKEANDTRFEYRKISLLHHIKERGYHLDNTLWNRVYDLSTNDSTREDQPSMTKGTKQCPWLHHNHHAHAHPTTPTPRIRLTRLHTALHTEYTSPFPTPKINFFAIYLACIRIISIISDKTHPSSEKKAGQNTPCLCFLDSMLAAADRYRENEHRMQPFGCKELVTVCGEAMQTVLEGREVGEFLWVGV